MKFVTNFALYDGCLDQVGTMADVAADCRQRGLDGLEIIWDHRPYTQELPPAGLAVGYHLTFWSYWLDFWRQDKSALLKEFGSQSQAREYFRGATPDDMVARYREDLSHALELGAEYLVFHVSDVSLEECFTYDFAHTSEQVIDAAIELANRITEGLDPNVAFLCENIWWPGLTFTDPALTQRLMDGIAHPNKGIMLDIGHLLHTNNKLRTQREAAAYVGQMLDGHGRLADYVRGLHLHQSLTGPYVEKNAYRPSDAFKQASTYWEKFSACYDHVLRIDEHQPWTDPSIGPLVRRINPEWVNNELSAWPWDQHLDAASVQMDALEAGLSERLRHQR